MITKHPLGHRVVVIDDCTTSTFMLPRLCPRTGR